MEGIKDVVVEIPRVIKLFSDGSVERPPPQSALCQRIPPSNNTFINGVATTDETLNHTTKLWVRIYLPETSKKKKLPLLLHFHGGGLCLGHADWRMYYHFYSRVARELEVVVVSVDYRLAPEHRLPAACHDCIAAVDWLRSLTKRQHWLTQEADLRRCFLMGESGGASLVHNTVTVLASAAKGSCDEDEDVCIRGSILIHPGFLEKERSKSEVESVPKKSIIVETGDAFLKMCLPEGCDRDYPVLNPMSPHAPCLKGLKLPRMFVAIADGDFLRDGQLDFCKAMMNAGQRVQVIVSENVEHCFHENEFIIAKDPHTVAQVSNLLASVHRFIKDCLHFPNPNPNPNPNLKSAL